MFRRALMILCVVSLVAYAISPASAVVMTNFADIGNTIGGTESMGFALNTAGTVAGYGTTAAGGLGTTSSQGFRYTYGGGIYGSDGFTSTVDSRGINAAGYQVGKMVDPANSLYQAYLYNGTSVVGLGGDVTGMGNGYGNCINANNIVGGQIATATASINAGIWYDPINNPTSITNLRPLLAVTPYSCGTGGQAVVAMNAHFALVGYSQGLYTKSAILNLDTHAFTGNPVTGLGGNNQFPGSGSGAAALQGGGVGISSNFDNAGNGWIAGAGNDSTASNQIRAYIAKLNGSTWTMTRLGSLGGSTTIGRAISVNASGDAVGWSYLSDGSTQHAFIYTGGTMQDLNTVYASVKPANFTMTFASDINDAGWITGYGTDGSGHTHGFLLYTVPEPSSVLLLAGGLVGLLAYAWRKRK
jgi:probable HAF family extracellular repeat protein